MDRTRGLNPALTESPVLLWDARNKSPLLECPLDLPARISFLTSFLNPSKTVVRVYSPPVSPKHTFTAHIVVDENSVDDLIVQIYAKSVLETSVFSLLTEQPTFSL